MSADLVALIIVSGFATLIFSLRVYASILTLVLLSSWLLSLAIGDDISRLLANLSSIFSTNTSQFFIYILLITIPVVGVFLAYRHGNVGSWLSQFITSMFIGLLAIVVILDISEVTSYKTILNNSYFAAQITRLSGFMVLLAFISALFELLNEQTSHRIRSKRGQRKHRSKKAE